MVIVRDDYLPCGVWKLALIKEFILSKDALICTTIQLPNKHISRAINHLFPLEIFSVVNDDRELSLGGKGSSCDVIDDDGKSSSRKTAAKVYERILQQLQNEVTLVLYSPSPDSVTKMN